MKKVIGALLAASVVGGAVSADVAVKLQTRIRPSLYTMEENYKDDGSKTSTLWDFGKGNGSHNDVLNITAKGENCGVDVEISLQNEQSIQADNAGVEANNDMKATSSGGNRGIDLDGLYHGWMKWGGFGITVGQWDDRFINRYNWQVVEGGTGSMDNSTAKWGVSDLLVHGKTIEGNPAKGTNLAGPKTYKSFLFDFNNTGAIGDAKHTAFVLDYALGLDFGKFDLKAGLVANNYNEESEKFWDKEEDVSYQDAGYVAELDFTMTDMFQLEAIFKKPTEHTVGFGIYGALQAVENLDAALGFTFGTISEFDYYGVTDEGEAKRGTPIDNMGGKKTQNKVTAYAVEARAFYQIIDPLRVGLQAKFSSWKEDNVNNDKADLGLEVIASAQYVMNDLFSAQFDAGIFMMDLEDEDGYDLAENYVLINPAVKFSASKQAGISAGVKYQFAINGGDAEDFCTGATKYKLTIPVIARIKI